VEPRRLRSDDPEFNPKRSLGTVALQVTATNALTWAVDRYVFGYSWARVGVSSWKKNFQLGCVWDIDTFNMNFFFHPYSGGASFNAARAGGYGYLESVPLALLGSLMWEYLGETNQPAYNDVINTTISGALFGEILYRLSSLLLDDRTTGAERFFREFGAMILSPGRAVSRLLQGEMTRITAKEIYQKEPLNVTLTAGAHVFNKGTSFFTGSLSSNFDIHLDYGNPFEIRPRKPFDFFKLRTDLSFGKSIGGRYLDNFIGYGLLFGKTIRTGNLDVLLGAFQHYNYWDSKIFRISTMAFGGGVVGKWHLPGKSNVQAVFHLGLIPLGASDSPHIDFLEEGVHVRNYDYSGGVEAKLEATLNLLDRGQVTAIYYAYSLHTYVGPPGYKNVAVFKPRVAVRLTGNVSLGFEYLFYHKDSFYRDIPDEHKGNSEQKLYLLLYF